MDFSQDRLARNSRGCDRFIGCKGSQFFTHVTRAYFINHSPQSLSVTLKEADEPEGGKQLGYVDSDPCVAGHSL